MRLSLALCGDSPPDGLGLITPSSGNVNPGRIRPDIARSRPQATIRLELILGELRLRHPTIATEAIDFRHVTVDRVCFV